MVLSSVIETTADTADVEVNGTGGAGDTGRGVVVNGWGQTPGRIASRNGNVTVTGFATAVQPGVSAWKKGVSLTDVAVIESTGSGSLTVTGIGAEGSDGVYLSIDTAVIRSGTGTVRVTATAANLTMMRGGAIRTAGDILLSAAGEVNIGVVDAGPLGTVTITADSDGDGTGGITNNFTGDNATNVFAARLAMSAGGNIGDIFRIATRVSRVEAESAAGKVGIANLGGDLTVGGVSDSLSGIRALGNVFISTVGSFFLTGAGEGVTSGQTAQIYAVGAASDAVLGGGSANWAIDANHVVVSADRDILVGDPTAQKAGNIRAGNWKVWLDAGRSIVFDFGSRAEVTGGSDIPAFIAEADRNIVLKSGTSVTTRNGYVSFSANAAGTGTGNFVGIDVDGATIFAETRHIYLRGRGGNSGDENYGVRLSHGATVSSAGTGRGSFEEVTLDGVTIQGTGGAGVGRNSGVLITDAGTSVTAADGDVTVTGTANGTGDRNIGVHVIGGRVEAAGRGKAVVTGTGGAGVHLNRGVYLQGAGSTVAAGAGGAIVTGTGRGSGGSNSGVVLIGGGRVFASGTGTVTLVGAASLMGNAGGVGGDNVGVQILGSTSQVLTTDGKLLVTGTGSGQGGAAGRNFGVELSSGGKVTGSGAGSVEVRGTAGPGGNDNVGVLLTGAGSSITATAGALTVTGNGRGTGARNYGVGVQVEAVIVGGGAVSVTGLGSAAGVDDNGGVATYGAGARKARKTAA
jgi:hypothetical protein